MFNSFVTAFSTHENVSRTVRLCVLCAAATTFAMSRTAFASPDELQVHLGELAKPGEFAVDVISNAALAGPAKPAAEGLRSSLRLLQVSPEFSYGLTKSTQVGLQLFSAIDTHGKLCVDGARAGLTSMLIRPDDEDDDGLFAGGIIEAGRLPRTLSLNRLDGELKLILGYRTGRWLLAINPEVGRKLSGLGSTAADLSASAKLGYKVNSLFSVSAEHYGDLGTLQRIGSLRQQSQLTFGVIDFKVKGSEINVGIGRGWNAHSERWILKMIVSVAL